MRHVSHLYLIRIIFIVFSSKNYHKFLLKLSSLVLPLLSCNLWMPLCPGRVLRITEVVRSCVKWKRISREVIMNSQAEKPNNRRIQLNSGQMRWLWIWSRLISGCHQLVWKSRHLSVEWWEAAGWWSEGDVRHGSGWFERVCAKNGVGRKKSGGMEQKYDAVNTWNSDWQKSSLKISRYGERASSRAAGQ